MSTPLPSPWLTLLLLGAVHGINPGMGWLFAVGLGLQRQERGAVWRALLPLAAGHALSVAAVLTAAAAVGLVLPSEQIRWMVAAMLLAMAVLQWNRHRHPRWGGMQVGARDLTIWSFLMATGHGAGLMALPFALDAGALGAGSGAHAAHAAHVPHVTHAGSVLAAGAASTPEAAALLAMLVHTAGYLVVTGAVAVLVYERLGLRLLRRGWVNLDRIWAAALAVTGLLVMPL